MEFTEPFSDCRMLPTRMGTANRSSLWLMDPSVSERAGDCGRDSGRLQRPTRPTRIQPAPITRSSQPGQAGAACDGQPEKAAEQDRRTDVDELAAAVALVERELQRLDLGGLDAQSQITILSAQERTLLKRRQRARRLDDLRRLLAQAREQSAHACPLLHPFPQDRTGRVPHVELGIQLAAQTFDVEQRLLQQHQLRLNHHVEAT